MQKDELHRFNGHYSSVQANQLYIYVKKQASDSPSKYAFFIMDVYTRDNNTILPSFELPKIIFLKKYYINQIIRRSVHEDLNIKSQYRRVPLMKVIREMMMKKKQKKNRGAKKTVVKKDDLNKIHQR